ncbi:MAG: family 10 glycosylhydrolase [Acidobacteriota bacterium]|nr:family 10 glycosylhydrolase [Acidobacteriota bacterium]
MMHRIRPSIRGLAAVVIGLSTIASLAAAPRPASPAAEIRAVWAHPGQFPTDPAEAKARMKTVLDAWSRAGIDTVIMLVKTTSGQVYWPSKIAERDPAYAGYDLLGLLIEEAGPRGLTIQPWFCVFDEGAIVGQVRQHPEWLIRSPKNELIGIVNPALPEVREYERSLMLEVASTYPVDWIHLDYIRYPCSPSEVYFSWDPRTRALFKEYSGVDPIDIKARDSGNILWNEWIDWNRGQVTTFLRELRTGLASLGRTVKVSAAVFPSAGEARVLIGQDWPVWCREGLVDMLCPMLYTNNLGYFEKYARQAMAAAAGRIPVLPGLGIGTSHNQATPEIMMAEIEIGRKLGASGHVLFSGTSLKPEFLEALRADRAKAVK